jgi:hypothetical protein
MDDRRRMNVGAVGEAEDVAFTATWPPTNALACARATDSGARA